jgi:hypothetical protein
MTVYPGNLDLVPEMVRWANEHIDMVHSLVFIGFRNAALEGGFDYFANGEKIELGTSYTKPTAEDSYLTSSDIYAKIKENFSHYETSAYMGGSSDPEKVTWLVSAQLGSKGQMYGSVGPKVVELFQVLHHVLYGDYVIYTPSNKVPKIALLLLGLIDKGVRRASGGFWRDFLRRPLLLFRPIYVQSIGIIQGPDLLPDGRVDMCESCPDMTVWNGKLVYSCRMDEWRLYGNYVTAHPRQQAQPVIEAESIPVAMPGD